MDFEFSKNAEIDLNNIILYIKNKLNNELVARNLVNKTRKAIDTIKLFPEMYELISNDLCEYKNIRRIPIDNYNLYYSFDEEKNKLILVRILYAHYNFDKYINI